MASSSWMLSAWFITALAANRRTCACAGRRRRSKSQASPASFAGEGAELLDGRHPVVLRSWRLLGSTGRAGYCLGGPAPRCNRPIIDSSSPHLRDRPPYRAAAATVIAEDTHPLLRFATSRSLGRPTLGSPPGRCPATLSGPVAHPGRMLRPPFSASPPLATPGRGGAPGAEPPAPSTHAATTFAARSKPAVLASRGAS